MSFTIEVSELPESITEFKPIPRTPCRMGMAALAITSTEKQAETMAYSKPLKEGHEAHQHPQLHGGRNGDHGGRHDHPKDVVGVDGVNTESVVPAIAFYPYDLDSFGDGNVTYLWPRRKG